MSIKDTIRAWKDRSYRESLSQEQRTQLLANPIGDALSEEELQTVTGGLPNTCATDGNDACSCSGWNYCVNSQIC